MIKKMGNKMIKKEVIAWDPPIKWIREKIELAGTTIGSVHFKKRSDGKLRKMSYRLHVKNPSIASIPKGLMNAIGGKFLEHEVSDKVRVSRKDVDMENNQMTAFDANKVIRDDSGVIIGRGAWRTIPLERVERICNKGVLYIINR